MTSQTLTDKQKRFVEEYLVDLNATQAAIRAGYSERTARAAGHKLLTKPAIIEAVQAAKDQRSERTAITQDDVLRELARLGFSNMADYVSFMEDGNAYVDLSKVTRDQAAAITEVVVEEYTEGRGDDARDIRRVKFKLADKKSSLELIGKHLGMFVDRHRIEGHDGGPINPLNEIFADAAGREAAVDLVAEVVARKRAKTRDEARVAAGIDSNGNGHHGSNGNGNGHRPPTPDGA